LATLAIGAIGPGGNSSAVPKKAAAARSPWKTIRVGGFNLKLDPVSQTARGLSPATGADFDFLPIGRARERAGNGYNHLGDIHVRLRSGDGPWQDFSSSRQRRPVHILPARGDVMAAANITASMGSGLPLRIVREWVKEGNGPALRFTLTNTSSQAVEIGALGMPMTFDNIITDRNLEQAHAQASFADPYIGRDAGYVQVTRLNGAGPALL
ncbi:DUF5695 domain-containing protein, partial [Staphylococcus aureus]|nr:DUF5695 domain-containing protein [Staphylococcus aureus]